MEVAKANTTGGSFRLTSPERAPNDLMDGEWALVERLIPPAKRGGNKRTANVREVVDGLMCVPEHRRGEPDRRNHRQPERQERGKRGSCIDPPGYASIPLTLRKLCNPA